MHYVVQRNIFKEENYDKIFYALTKLGLSFEVIDYHKDFNGLKVETTRKDIFPFGSIKLGRLSAEMDWVPGSFYGKNHDYEIYAEFYKENLLNWGCKLQDITDNIDWLPNEQKFIRPSKDSKIFTGAVFSKIKWLDTIKLVEDRCGGVLPDITVQVNSVQKIYKEARVWIVGGKVVTSSYYFFNSNVAYSENVDPEGLEFAQSMADLYQVADAFVMDICLTPDGWKIVEINCINCSGFYKGDLQRLLIALEDFYNPIK